MKGQFYFNGLAYVFNSMEDLVYWLKENNDFESFVECFDLASGRCS